MSSVTADEHDEEQKHYDEVVASMRHYYIFFRRTLTNRMQKHHALLTPAQIEMLPGGHAGIQQKVAAYDDALRTNQLFFDQVLLHIGEFPSALTTDFDPSALKRPAYALGSWLVPTHHANKLSGTLHCVARDWTADGAVERAEAYEPVLKALSDALPKGGKVLVPGSGLARLVCEIAGAGYRAQGNDFDLFMLFTAQYLLNGFGNRPRGDGDEGSAEELDGESGPRKVVIHPWVHGLGNHLSHADALKRAEVPDTRSVQWWVPLCCCCV